MSKAATSSQPKDAPAVRIRYRPQGATLAQFHKSKAFVRLVIGPLGSAKTYAAINEVMRLCHTQTPDKNHVRRSRWLVARNSFPNLAAATIPDFKTVLNKLNPDGWKMSAPIRWAHEYDRDDGTKVEVEIMFRAFDGPQDVVDARGMQLTGVYVDEGAEFNKENLDMLIGRVKRYPSKADVPDAEFDVLITSNSCAKDHWMAKLALNPIKPANWWVGIQPGGVIRSGNTWIENPAAENITNLAKNYYLDQLGAKKESWIRQNLANEFVVHSDGRAIHPSFNENIHVQVCKYVPGITLHIGMDFGRTPAAVIMQHNGSQWQVLKELVTYNMGADKFAPILRKVLNTEFHGAIIETFTGDPSGSSMSQADDHTPFRMLEEAGFEAQPADTNDPEVRYSALDKQLDRLVDGQPAIIVDPSCETLVRGLAGEYQFRRLQVAGREEYTDKADKGVTSHVCEALHYGLMGAGEGDVMFDSAWDEVYSGLDQYATPDFVYE